MKPHLIIAIVRRELASYFSSPTGYVFITIFIFLSGLAAFWTNQFFARNLANLDLLNQWFPALLLFLVPAITMGAWAEERRQGTDDLLLTLPARDSELLAGKYLACVAIYTVALAFSASHVGVLALLGSPDWGLMACTYLGYWLAGAGLIAVGIAASALTANLTVSFIAGVAACGFIIGLGLVAGLLPQSTLAEVLSIVSFHKRLADFGRGVIAAPNVAYFAALAAVGLAAGVHLIGKRRWSGSPRARGKAPLLLVRLAALAVAGASIVVLLSRVPLRADATAERLWSLSPATVKMVSAIPAERPVLIKAYVSPDVPTDYVQTRETLLGVLQELDAASGGARIAVEIVPTRPYTEEAREAQRTWNITPREVYPDPNAADPTPVPVYMGVAFSCGPEQFVIPFLNRGLSVEYELARSIRSVTTTQRKRIGVLDTQVAVWGQINFQTFRTDPDWQILEELRKLYTVVRVNRGEPVRADTDVLVVPQISTLTEPEFEFVLAEIKAGKPTLIFEDPLPIIAPPFATAAPRVPNQDPLGVATTGEEPKPDLNRLYSLLGVRAPADRVLWDVWQPHPELGELPPEYLFIGPGSGDAQALNPDDPITAGLQELVLLCAGGIERDPQAPATLTYTPLVRTTGGGGWVNYNDIVKAGRFNPERRRNRESPAAVVARITGVPAPSAPDSTAPAPIDVILCTDLDMISELFFALREQSAERLKFDNIGLVLNAVDALLQEDDLIALRARRAVPRTLAALDRVRQEQDRIIREASDQAQRQAEAELEAARARMQKRLDEIDARDDLDARTKEIQRLTAAEAEQRALDVRTVAVNDERAAKVIEARIRARQEVERAQMGIRLAAVALPPLPALALAGAVFALRRAREREGVSRERLRA